MRVPRAEPYPSRAAAGLGSFRHEDCYALFDPIMTPQVSISERPEPALRSNSILRRLPPLGALALVALHMAAAWKLRRPGITTGNDDALYVLLSRSIRHLTYSDTHLLDAPPHVQYPPGYPALLALVSAAFGESPDHFMLLGVICSGLALVFWYDIARRLWSPWLGLGVVAAAGSNPWLVQYAGSIASEAPYLLSSTVALWLLIREDRSRMYGLLGGLVAIVSALVRSFGATLVVAFGLHWLFARRFRRAAIFAAAVAVTLGAWFAWTIGAGPRIQGRSYVEDLAVTLAQDDSAAARIWFHAGRVVSVLTRRIPSVLAVPTVESTRLDNVLWLVVIVVSGAAGAWVLWRRSSSLPLYVVAVLLLMVLWPYSLTRFLVPLVPPLLLLLLVGVTLTRRHVPPAVATALAVILTLVLAGGGWARTMELAGRMAPCERASAQVSPGCYNENQRSFFAAARFAADSTPADAAFLTAKEAAFAYYARRRVVYPGALRGDAGQLLAALRQRGIRYVVLGRNAEIESSFLAQALERSCDQLELVATFPPRTYLFEVTTDSRTLPGSRACEAIRTYRADPTPILPVR